MNNHPDKTNISLATASWRTRMVVAFSLMTVIPVLSLGYFLVIYLIPHVVTYESISLVMILNLILSLTGFSLVINILKSLSRFRKYIESIAQGDLTRSMTLNDGPEVNSIVKSVDVIVKRIHEDHKWLKTFSRQLEKMVEERTAELKQANDELKNSRERFAKAFHASPIPIVISRVANGRIIDVNRRFLDMMGYQDEDITGRTLLELKIGANVEEQGRLAQILQEKHRISRIELSLKTRSAETRHVIVSMELIKISGNICALTMFYDITERKRTEEELRNAYDDLQKAQDGLIQSEKMAATGELAAGIAHELRNPLANIISSLQFCLRTFQINEELNEHFSAILRNAENANKIIQDLLDFAKPGEFALAPTDISEVIERACELIKGRCATQHVQLAKNVSQGLPPVQSDEKRLEAAFINIMLNALDAMPDSGSLSIAASFDPNQKEIEIRFSDTGTGIPEENLDKIIKPFFSTRDGGVGLGLTLVNQIVSAHTGTLKVDSEIGQGTRVTISLPVSK